MLVVNHALLLSDVATRRQRAAGVPASRHRRGAPSRRGSDEPVRLHARRRPTCWRGWTGRTRAAGATARAGLTATRRHGDARRRRRRSARRRSCRRSRARWRRSTTRARDRVPAFFRALQQFGSGAQQRTQRLRRAHHDQSRHAGAAGLVGHRGGLVQDGRAARGASSACWRSCTRRCRRPIRRTCSITTPWSPRRSDLLDDGEALRAGLSRIIGKDDRETICWLTMGRRDASPSLSSAPLSVAETLRTGLYGSKESVVLTSATLSTEDNFDYIKGRLGFEDSRELLLGSPFDYKRSTLILAPSDMPEPDQQGYLAALQTAIIELVTASQGRALVLFTSHGGLRAAYQGIKRQLEEQEILVLGQGIDGAPRQLLATLKENPAHGGARRGELLGGRRRDGRRAVAADHGAAAVRRAVRPGVPGALGAVRPAVRAVRAAAGDPALQAGLRAADPAQDGPRRDGGARPPLPQPASTATRSCARCHRANCANCRCATWRAK